MIVRFKENDTLVMKKNHPCGANRMTVMHAGSDVKLRCQRCGHDMMVARVKIEKNIKQVISNEQKEN